MKIKYFLFALFTFILQYSIVAQVFINEYSASNLIQLPDNFNKYEDWVELYNESSEDVDLGGWYLSDKKSKPKKWKIPANTIIPAKGFLLFFCSGRDMVDGDYIHTNFKIAQTKGNEDLVLTKPDGTTADKVDVAIALLAHSTARETDGDGVWRVCTLPSPKVANFVYPKFDRYTKAPVIHQEAGFYGSAMNISIGTEETNAEIRYTLDSTEPTETSPLYTQPILISKTTVVKAKVFSKDKNIIPGKMTFHTFFIGEDFSLPVFSVSAEQMLELATGTKSLRPVGSLEYFDKDGKRQATSYGELNSHGQDSWKLNHRSIDWISRDEMGYSKGVLTKLFSYSDRDDYQRFMFRSSGDDNYPAIEGPDHEGSTHLRDEYVHVLAQEGGMHLDVRAVERVIVFFNGQYWGLYGLRERPADHDYTDAYFKQDKFNIQYLTTWSDTEAEYGGMQAYIDWGNIRDFILENDMGDKQNYDFATDNIDMLSLIDFFIMNTNSVAADWLNYNTGWWRGLDPKGGHKKWGYILWDMDATFDYYLNYTGIPNRKADAKPCDIDSIANLLVTFYDTHFEVDQKICPSMLLPSFPYPMDDTLFARVVEQIPACCDSAWDTPCQELYNELAKVNPPPPPGLCKTFTEGHKVFAATDTIYHTVTQLDRQCCSQDWDPHCQAYYDQLAAGQPIDYKTRQDLGMHEKIFLKLIAESPTFKQLYYSRQADLMNTVFSCENMNTTLEGMVDLLKPEMPRQIERWGGSMEEWEQNLDRLRTFIDDRCNFLQEGMLSCYDDLEGAHDLVVTTDPPNMAAIEFNTLTIENLPWSASYFGGMEHLVKIVNAEDGYTFSHWESKAGNFIADSKNPTTSIRLAASDTLTAVFADKSVGIDDLDLNLSVRIYPNPAKDNLIVEYQMEERKKVDISLHSVLGQKVATFAPRDSLGQQKAHLSLEEKDLTPGLYFVVFNVDGKQRSYKVTIE